MAIHIAKLYKVISTLSLRQRSLLVYQLACKAIKLYFPMVLFNMLYGVVLTFKPEDKKVKCDHLNATAPHFFPVVLFINCTKRLPLLRIKY